MFYDIFKSLCDAKGISVTKATEEIGLSRTIGTKWKKSGATPNGDTLSKIAEYFHMSVGDLLAGTTQKETPPAEAGSDNDVERMIDDILSTLTDSSGATLMLDGKPTSQKAIEYLRESIRANIEHAKKINKEKEGG